MAQERGAASAHLAGGTPSVALVLMGVAASGLVSALSSDLRLRGLAASHAFAAAQSRERLEALAGLPCTGAASGTSSSAWGDERWQAVPQALAWTVTDSIVLRSSAAPVVLIAHVACPE